MSPNSDQEAEKENQYDNNVHVVRQPLALLMHKVYQAPRKPNFMYAKHLPAHTKVSVKLRTNPPPPKSLSNM